MHRLFAVALAIPALVLVTGCESLVTGGDLIRPGEPTGVIQVINETSDDIDVVLISACDVGSYGLNRLPTDMAIPPGGSYAWDVSAGCWDVGAGTIGYGDARQRLSVPADGVFQYTVTG